MEPLKKCERCYEEVPDKKYLELILPEPSKKKNIIFKRLIRYRLCERCQRSLVNWLQLWK